MNPVNTEELKTELTSALDYMMAADARNSQKHIKVRDWFSSAFKAAGRASRVSETKQAYNRVPEQFKHRDQHVIFVVDDDGTGSVIEAQVMAKQYSGLNSCLVLKKIYGGYGASVLMMASDSPVNLFFKAAYPGVRVEPLGQVVSARQITPVAGTLNEIHEHFCDDSREHGLHINIDLGLRFACSLLSKRFVILTGLAGSGKTKLAQAFARWMSASVGCYEVVSVGADWTGNENILGYPNGLDKETYISKATLDLINHAEAHEDIPHFLILDEMNLSHVERYFADILSAIESEEEIKLYDGGARTTNDGKPIPRSVALPKNLFIIGTVNVDETTYMFSPKVLDRANVIEFRMDVVELAKFLSNPAKPDLSNLNGKGTSYRNAFVDAVKNPVTVPDDVKTEYDAEMLLLFKTLQTHGAEFGYRTAYETARFIHFYKRLGNHTNGDTTWFPGAFDCVVLQKLLPKLHGSRSKLGPVLKKLWFLCVNDPASRGTDALTAAEEAARSTDKKAEPSIVLPAGTPYPLSAEKIGRMWRLLIENGFASFAEA
jgi:5-methylcytosine-specific restriction protein B